MPCSCGEGRKCVLFQEEDEPSEDKDKAAGNNDDGDNWEFETVKANSKATPQVAAVAQV